MSFFLELTAQHATLHGHPRISAWLQRTRDRPAYQRAVERVGTYTPRTKYAAVQAFW